MTWQLPQYNLGREKYIEYDHQTTEETHKESENAE
jgi:hypothetical protein